MKRGVVSEKLASQNQKQNNKKNSSENQNAKNNNMHNRLLITVNVLGSAGPIRFVVNEDDHVSGVIDTALKLYAREGRLPILGSDVNNFLLYPANEGLDALNPSQLIGSIQGRIFMLCKKQRHPQVTEASSDLIAPKGNNSGWKAWLHKPFHCNIVSH